MIYNFNELIKRLKKINFNWGMDTQWEYGLSQRNKSDKKKNIIYKPKGTLDDYKSNWDASVFSDLLYDKVENKEVLPRVNLDISSRSNDLIEYRFDGDSTNKKVTLKDCSDLFFETLKESKIEYNIITSKYIADKHELHYYLINAVDLFDNFVKLGFDRKLMKSDTLL